MSVEVVLGLGSNLGNKFEHLKNAINKLQQLQIINQVISSSIHQSKALLKEGSPKEWDLDYLNLAVKGITKLAPLELLKEIKNIEKLLGKKDGPRWSPREIDIDILSYGNEVIKEENLIVPHIGLLERIWALAPFAEVNRNWRYPVLGIYYQLTIEEIIQKKWPRKLN